MADRSLDGAQAAGPRDDSLWGHRWGFRDTCFKMGSDGCVEVTGNRYNISGTRMPDFHPFAKEVFGMPGVLSQRQQEVPLARVGEPRLPAGFLAHLQERFPASRYSMDDRERVLHSHGQTTADEVLRVLYGELERVVDLVFYPESDDDVVGLLSLAREFDLCLVPYGGGTSVTCALKLPHNEQRTIVSIDTRRMNKVEWIDRDNMRACVQAGITGKQLEDYLGAEGLTCGHEPDSSELSTLGGWIATNASGMKKNRYGNIEDLVEQLTLVTPAGVVANHQVQPRVSMGFQPERVVFGSEGTLGLITRAVIRVFPLPEARQFGSIVFPDFDHGVSFLRELARQGPIPASIRLVDNMQFRFSKALKPAVGPLKGLMRLVERWALQGMGYAPNKVCAATVLMEGTREEVRRQSKEVYKLAWRHRGFSGGESNGQRGYALTYAIAYIRDFLAEYQIVGETMETTVPWNAIHAVINAVNRSALEEHARYRLPGTPFISARVTQVYHSGVCIYVTHGVSMQGIENRMEISSAMEKAVRRAILEAGGSISHHHGVGKIRSEFLPQLVTPAGVEMVRGIKNAADPGNMFGIANNFLAEHK